MKPVILVVDDDRESLASLVDALTRRYGADYRVASNASPSAALEDLEQIRARGESVALIIADQWMPGIEGLEMLGRAHEIHPAAQRALLVDWGDRSAAPAILEGCAFGQLENYLRKPWFPPEVHLYPAIGEFLADWTRAHGPRMELVQVIGDDPSRRTHDVREFLTRSGIPHGFSAAGSEAGRAALEEVGLDGSRLPVLVLLDGRALIEPSNKEISDALGATNLDERECEIRSDAGEDDSRETSAAAYVDHEATSRQPTEGSKRVDDVPPQDGLAITFPRETQPPIPGLEPREEPVDPR